MCSKEIPLETMVNLLKDFNKMGATKLTIMGGEPAMYGDKDHKKLMRLISEAKSIGYNYVRMDTNGQFEDDFLGQEGMKQLDEVSFSIDGYNAEIHDYLRGEGAFDKCIKNVKKAVKLGYNVDVTACIHKKLVGKGKDKLLGIDKMIDFIGSLGVNRINFHVLFKHGFPMDTWTDDTALNWEEWASIYEKIGNNIKKGRYKIHVRNPQHFVTQEEFKKSPEYYGYCAAKLGERVLVHPDGMIRICSGLISSKYCVAKYYDDKIVWEKGLTNELNDHNLDRLTPCTNQSKSMECGKLLPLCFSFKPGQKEIVWERKIKWEDKKSERVRINGKR